MPEISPSTDIRLVCFDIGGVLVRICRSWPEGCAAAGLPLRDGVEDLLERKLDRRRELSRLYQTGRLDTDAYCAHVSDEFGGLYSAAEIRAIHDAWLLGEYEGLAGVIDAVDAVGCETACLSNINPTHWERISREFPAVARLRHKFGSHLVGHAKPDHVFYRALEEGTGVSGSAIIFFDDLIENVEAARELGWRAVHIDHEQPTDGQILAALAEHDVLDGAAAATRSGERG